MPAPLPVDREQVRMLAASVGQREAARQLGMSENTVKSICHRAGDGPRRERAALDAKYPQTVRAPDAPKPVEKLLDTLAADGQATKIAGMRYARRATERAAQLPEDELLAEAPNVKAVLGTAQIAGAWAGAGGSADTVINIALIGQDVRFGHADS